MLSVYFCYDKNDLPKSIRDEYDKDDFDYDARSVIVVEHDGTVIFHHLDGGEPEDNRFYRYYSWIGDIVEKAYEIGVEDGTKYS